MSLFNRSHRANTSLRQGRPGTVRAVIAGVGVLLLGAATISGLRMAEAQDGSQTAQSTPTDAAVYAMAQLVAPPSSGTFGVADQADIPDEAITLASSTTTSKPDCVKQLEQFLTPIFVNFEAGSAGIGPQNISLLSRISEKIMACDAAYVMVAGHADGSGDDAVNLALSWERADRTLNSLLMLGVDPFAVEALGFGARAPLSQGSDEEGNADRRVDFRVMRKP